MRLRAVLCQPPTALGFQTSLLFVILAGFFVFQPMIFFALANYSGPENHPFLGGVIPELLGALGAAYAIWIVLVARRVLTTAAGGGFIVAAVGVQMHVWVECALALPYTLVAHPATPEPLASPRIQSMLDLFGVVGLIAFAVGLTLATWAVLAELRLRRRTPRPILPLP